MSASLPHAELLELKPITSAPAVAVQMKRLNPRAALPEYKTPGAAGMDLSACLPEGTEALVIEPGQIVKVPLGFAMALPVGYEAQIRARSGLSSTHGITPVNSPGTIDSDYRGEVIVPLINLGREPFTVTHGMRIAQMVIAPVVQARITEVEALDETARGTGGFGSTGRH
jgi:dUTP pyrophosphatase